MLHPFLPDDGTLTAYQRAAQAYLDARWRNPIPLRSLRAGDKHAGTPPKGVTGGDGADLTPERVGELAALTAYPDVALRMSEDVFGIDLDGYDGRVGAEVIARAEVELGPLPPTFKSTSRGPGQPSGISHYRLPAGTPELADAEYNLRMRFGVDLETVGDGGGIHVNRVSNVEIVRRGHRFTRCAPSVHRNGGVYAWYGPDASAVDGAPPFEELPLLPPAWVEFLSTPRPARVERRARAAAESGQPADPFERAGFGGGDPDVFTESGAAKWIARGLAELASTPSGEIRKTLWHTAKNSLGPFVECGHLDEAAAREMLLSAVEQTAYDAATWQADDPIDQGLDAVDRAVTVVADDAAGEDTTEVADCDLAEMLEDAPPFPNELQRAAWASLVRDYDVEIGTGRLNHGKLFAASADGYEEFPLDPAAGQARLAGWLRDTSETDLSDLSKVDLAAVVGRFAAVAQAWRRCGHKAQTPAAGPAGGGAAGEAWEGFFDGDKLQIETAANHIRKAVPVALTAEQVVAVYRDGAYRIDRSHLLGVTTAMLGEDWRNHHHSDIEKFLAGRLIADGVTLPERADVPLLNVANGMLDLRHVELLEHDPAYLSSVQLPVAWDPGAKAPHYEAWLAAQIPDQADDLEECASLMLDPTITPSKAVFCFGPSRSGKSTFLRLMRAIAGAENTSGVSLHQLAENRFAAANVFGKTLNMSADLSSKHVEDLSLFKMMTGEDLIHADRKFGAQFAFVNRALFAFSANELPTVGESSRAYSERIKPFHFGRSFAGAEDPSIEAAILVELPGILVRWVEAYRRRMARGTPLATSAQVRDLFELSSDRVRQFFAARCQVAPVAVVSGGTRTYGFATTTELYQAFGRWVVAEGCKPMAKSTVVARLRTIDGVQGVRDSAGRRGWNVQLHRDDVRDNEDPFVSACG